MSDAMTSRAEKKESIQGLACPRCGGMVPIPEGELIVRCPFCDLRSMVRGERGLQRYQVPRRIDRQNAQGALHSFLTSHRAIAFDAAKNSRLVEDFVAYVPFWVIWARILGWIMGQKKVKHGDNYRYEPREVKFAKDLTWNEAACDVGEFGVDTLQLSDQAMEAFNPGTLHSQGLVFEPVGSSTEARDQATQNFKWNVEKSAGLNKIAQIFVRPIRERMGLVYYPLWVMRYLYRGRSFQAVVDGYTGQILYGKAPGNSLYRAAVLVFGMGLGALVGIDGSAVALYMASQIEGDSAGVALGGALLCLGAGFTLIWRSYRAFRYGEQYEYHRMGKKAAGDVMNLKEIFSQVEDVSQWISR